MCGWSFEKHGDSHRQRNCRLAFPPKNERVFDPRFHPTAGRKKKSEMRKRAEVEQKPSAGKRAVKKKKPTSSKRAKTKQKPLVAKRASTEETPDLR